MKLFFSSSEAMHRRACPSFLPNHTKRTEDNTKLCILKTSKNITMVLFAVWAEYSGLTTSILSAGETLEMFPSHHQKKKHILVSLPENFKNKKWRKKTYSRLTTRKQKTNIFHSYHQADTVLLTALQAEPPSCHLDKY